MFLPVLGIDIAKETYVVALLVEARCYQREFPNRPASFKLLTTWLRKHRITHVHACMEATGRYGENLAEYLHQSGHTVSVVNPARIKAYMHSQLARNKTDQLDAELIARFCQTQQPPAWTPPPPEIRELQELIHQYTALQDDHQREANRLQAGLKGATVPALIQAHLDFLDQQIQQIKRLIHEHIDRYPHLKAHRELLTSIPGIGEATAAQLLAVEIQRFENGRALSAYGGLNPMNRMSGKSLRRKPRLSKLGHAALRKALYFPAHTAMRCNPIIRAFCERLAERGLCAMAIIGAVMRKLLCLAYGVLKSGRPFDPNYSINREFAA